MRGGRQAQGAHLSHGGCDQGVFGTAVFGFGGCDRASLAFDVRGRDQEDGHLSRERQYQSRKLPPTEYPCESDPTNPSLEGLDRSRKQRRQAGRHFTHLERTELSQDLTANPTRRHHAVHIPVCKSQNESAPIPSSFRDGFQRDGGLRTHEVTASPTNLRTPSLTPLTMAVRSAQMAPPADRGGGREK